MAGTNAKGVKMWALGVKDEAYETEASHFSLLASATSPLGHSGESTR